MGKGIEYGPYIGPIAEEINSDGESLEDIIRKCVVDLLIYNGFCIQVIFNKLGEINELYWINFAKVRVDEDRMKAYYSKNWKLGNKDFVELDVFDNKEKAGSKLFYFVSPDTRGTYPLPRYYGAINAIETSVEISKFHLANIKNGFQPSGIISFANGIPSDEVKNEIEAKIKSKFTGSEAAGSLIINWADSKENSVEFEKLSDDGLDEKFNTLRNDTWREIFMTWKAPGQLFNMQTENGLFTRDEYDQAFALFNSTVILPIQKTFIRAINKIYNVDDSIQFRPLDPYDKEGNINNVGENVTE